jgi:hypothetical protein
MSDRSISAAKLIDKRVSAVAQRFLSRRMAVCLNVEGKCLVLPITR